MCLWGGGGWGGWILLIEILCMVSMGMVNFAERERKTARVNKRKQKKGESGTEFVRTLPPSWRQSEEWETFSASFLPLIYCISFYFFTRRPLSPCFPRRSLPLSPFHSFFSSLLCHLSPRPSLCPPPSPSVFSSYSDAKEGQWHPMLCNDVHARARVKMSELIYSVLCSHRSMMPCSCLTKQPTDIEVRTQSYTQMCTRPHYVDTLKWDHDGVISSGDLAKKKFKQTNFS